jgi:uncharacterized protein YjiS (DUF1127 family)
MIFDLRLSRVECRSRETGRLRRAAERVLAWRERARQRRHLANLNDHMLRDIGHTRGDVRAESSKPFWRV